jgi:hypothetical protein
MWDVGIHGHPRYTVTNVRLSLLRMSLKSADLRAPKGAVFVAGVFLVAARWLLAGGAGESPYGSGETGEAGAGTGVLEECLIPVALKRVGLQLAVARKYKRLKLGGGHAHDRSSDRLPF